MKHSGPVPTWRLSAAALLAAVCLAQACRSTGSTGIARRSDGKPDLQGIWQVLATAAWDIQDHVAQPGTPAGMGVVEGGEIPYQAWAAEKQRENYLNRSELDPDGKCYLPGVPRITYQPFPFQIFQTSTQVTILYEYNHTTRAIPVDGAEHFPGDFWMGDSIGSWDGDTLVVDVSSFKADTWFDRAGNFHSDELHVIERYTPIGPDLLQYEVTVEDPMVFTRPWKMSMPLYRRREAGARLLEYECVPFFSAARARRRCECRAITRCALRGSRRDWRFQLFNRSFARFSY